MDRFTRGHDFIFLNCLICLCIHWYICQACADGPEGLDLHVKNGEEHNSLTPSAWGVPWPTWNGEGGDSVIDDTDRLGVIGYLCQNFYDNNLPGGICD